MVSQSTTNPTYAVECREGENFSLSLVASDVRDFTGFRLTVAYDPDELEVSDLCGFTPGKDITANGTIPGTKLIVKYEPGRIEFIMDENIAPGSVWSGEVTNIVFKPKMTGTTQLNFFAGIE